MAKQIIIDPATAASSVHITNMARRELKKQDVKMALDKHSGCNWGDVGGDEWAKNDEAYKSGGRIVSRYVSSTGKPFLISTEADRKTVTIFLYCEGNLKRAC